MPRKPKKPTARFQPNREYDFLKYIRVAYQWAKKNHPDLSRGDIEILLYLYGCGAFSRKSFSDYHKLIGLYEMKGLKRYVDTGYIKLFRPRKGKEYALYNLTFKAKHMCSKMHRYCCGDEEMPTDAKHNAIAKKEKRNDGYYLNIIKKMNKDGR